MSAQDAWYYSTPEGERAGPVTYQELRERIQGGLMDRADLVWAGHLTDWMPLERVPELAGWVRQLPPSLRPVSMDAKDQDLIDHLKTMEMASGIVWSLIAGSQILFAISMENCGSLFLFVTGVLNILAALSRFRMVKCIEKRQKAVIGNYESASRLVVIGIVNLLLGGIIGALWVIFDFVIRDKVLKNRHLFDQ